MHQKTILVGITLQEHRLLEFLNELNFFELPNGAATSPTPRWEQLARDHFEQGFMCLRRSIEKQQ